MALDVLKCKHNKVFCDKPIAVSALFANNFYTLIPLTNGLFKESTVKEDLKNAHCIRSN